LTSGRLTKNRRKMIHSYRRVPIWTSFIKAEFRYPCGTWTPSHTLLLSRNLRAVILIAIFQLKPRMQLCMGVYRKINTASSMNLLLLNVTDLRSRTFRRYPYHPCILLKEIQ